MPKPTSTSPPKWNPKPSQAGIAVFRADERPGRKRRPAAIAAAVTPAHPRRCPLITGYPNPARSSILPSDRNDKSPSPMARPIPRPNLHPCKPNGRRNKAPNWGRSPWAEKHNRNRRSGSTVPGRRVDRRRSGTKRPGRLLVTLRIGRWWWRRRVLCTVTDRCEAESQEGKNGEKRGEELFS